MTGDMKEYVKICSAIDRYNWLDNKVHLEHINKLHNLTIDILGRMAGFNTLFEREGKVRRMEQWLAGGGFRGAMWRAPSTAIP